MTTPFQFPVLLIDGGCSLCNLSARWILKLEKRPVLRFAALESEQGRQLTALYASAEGLPDSVVLIDEEGWHTKSRALVRIGWHAGGVLHVFGLLRFVPTKWADSIYDFVAKNRKRWFGQVAYCAMARPSERHRFMDAVPVDQV